MNQLNITRIEEIDAFAAAEGIALPIPAAEIVTLEDMGIVVDLHTGQMLEDVDVDEPIGYALTDKGRAWSGQWGGGQ